MSLYQCAVLILSRAVIFAFVPYNAPVRTWSIVKFANVNESPILYEAKCFMITKIQFWETCVPSLTKRNCIQITARLLMKSPNFGTP